MRWREGTRPVDAGLTDALLAADSFAPDVKVVAVLRHVAGRRVTALGDRDGAACVVKVFRGPRAKGNHTRLHQLHAAGAGHLVPTPIAHDDSGRVGVLGHRDGVVLGQLDDARFVTACALAGAALRELHGCGATLDRHWTVTDEIRQLRTVCPPSLLDVVATAARRHGGPALAPSVPSHRDCHPAQLVFDGSSVGWIDLDDCAMAPPGLDVGNMLAHLTRERVLRRRDRACVDLGRAAFREAYGWADEDELRRWEVLSLTRLAALAETRHGELDERDALVAEAQRCEWKVTA